VPVPREVEKDGALDALVVRCHRVQDGAVNRVCGLGRGNDPLAACKCDCGGEDVVLRIGLGSDEPVEDEL
jgi:hypothetical protein